MKSVHIYPPFDALYYSFYVGAVQEYFGESNVEFSYKNFPSLSSDYFAFIIEGEEKLRVVIDAYDGSRINDKGALEWCDVFGKVNLLFSSVPADSRHKCVAIGPSFPIQLWPLSKSFRNSIKHYRPYARIKSAREHFANYLRQYRDRLPLSYFVPGTVRENFVFFSSSIWTEEEAPRTNQVRASFMEVCKSMEGVTFEGGFSPRSDEYAQRYQANFAAKRYPFPEWLDKIKASVVVFNTPAVWRSHTFKLAEFLALGKAIISAPILRELPAPLIHGQHVHYVDGSVKSIRDAVTLIVNDRSYRMHLERNAYEYYICHLQPIKVIERLLNHRNRTALT
jgi:glycosyltransferase involved in cell wall biosynthesis